MAFVSGSMRASVPRRSMSTHTLPTPVTIGPATFVAASGIVAATFPATESTRTIDGVLQSLVQTAPKANNPPAHGADVNVTVDATAFVFGSIFSKADDVRLRIHSASPAANKSRSPVTATVASGVNFVSG